MLSNHQSDLRRAAAHWGIIDPSVRVASADWAARVATPVYLRAIDWTIGLLRDVLKNPSKNLNGNHIPGDPQELIRRLILLRGLAQDGMDLSKLQEQFDLVKRKGIEVLKSVAAGQDHLTPSERDSAAFFKEFPDGEKAAIAVQSKYCTNLIAEALGIDQKEVRHSVMSQEVLMNRAYDVLEPMLVRERQSIVAVLGSASESRVKEAGSCWGKQSRKNRPFYEFGDLIGCRIVAEDVRDLAAICNRVQSKLDIFAKDNRFLVNDAYNAIHYTLSGGVFCAELQVKTTMGDREAQLSHNLIYAPEKRVRNLTTEQARLIAMVIDISTQIGLRDLAAL